MSPLEAQIDSMCVPCGGLWFSDHFRAGEDRQGLVGMWLCASGVGCILQLKAIKSTSETFFIKSDEGLTVPECSHNCCSCAVLKKKVTHTQTHTHKLDNGSEFLLWSSLHVCSGCWIWWTYFSLRLMYQLLQTSLFNISLKLPTTFLSFLVELWSALSQLVLCSNRTPH